MHVMHACMCMYLRAYVCIECSMYACVTYVCTYETRNISYQLLFQCSNGFTLTIMDVLGNRREMYTFHSRINAFVIG
jgi:hypothetical protein